MIELVVLLAFSATLGSGLGLRLRDRFRPYRRYSWETGPSAFDVLEEALRNWPTINRLPPVPVPLSVPALMDSNLAFLMGATNVNMNRALSSSNVRVYPRTQSGSNVRMQLARKASVEQLFFRPLPDPSTTGIITDIDRAMFRNVGWVRPPDTVSRELR